MLEAGLSLKSAVSVLGFHPSTLLRWRQRDERHEPLVKRRGPRRHHCDVGARNEAVKLVRDLKGLVGVESLRHSVLGLTRREAAEIKHLTCTALERERQDVVERIHVKMPGSVRGFDSMQLGSRPEAAHLLVAADASVPYRTSWDIVESYNGENVADFLEMDLNANGSPLVLRLDRARQHATGAVSELLAARQVLVLHGPPYRATYYGQLERQNREHRAWLRAAAIRRVSPVIADNMMHALNARWRRRTLGFNTAQEVWSARPKLIVDRTALREEVTERCERIRRSIDLRGRPADLAFRLAIEQILEKRGFLNRSFAGRC